ncbi:hypothetical protein ONE63_001727 [Megalurothrips usitatus]|uniref:Peptidase S1 domain-containing protein n=1 Tax=Megalurothrips usitatus TaxID=439358 RepID=A0AAV7XDK9_9NEOP|nr:hypothetical protein ONE63_001727 [Megalurothrips usitatus]
MLFLLLTALALLAPPCSRAAAAAAAGLETGSASPNPCQHGGVLDGDRCRCTPGFKGKTCEIGCGNNLIGVDCKERCSNDQRRGCERKTVCGPEPVGPAGPAEPGAPRTCTCAPGFRGKSCNTLCSARKYGPDCKYSCGHCAGDGSCDPFSGQCVAGCSLGFQPPLCHRACGVANTARNGSVFPWQAGLYRRSDADNAHYEFQCGGSLIAEALVLTAAHCVEDSAAGSVQPAARYMVALGKTQSAWEAEEDATATKRQVSRIHVEPYYRGGADSFRGDIAVLVLERSVPVGGAIMPVCLNWTPDNEARRRTQVAGWGETENGKASETSYSVVVPVLRRDACIAHVEINLQAYVTSDKICAGFTEGAY